MADQDRHDGDVPSTVEETPPSCSQVTLSNDSSSTTLLVNPLQDDESFKWRLFMTYCSTVVDDNPLTWKAKITFHVKDLPRLMREGLYWSSFDRIPELGYCLINEELIDEDRSEGWQFRRVYTLIDGGPGGHGDGQDPQWHAEISLLSKYWPGDFRLEDLNNETMSWCAGSNPGKRLVYYWTWMDQPGQSLNTIYDDMPMEGAWPWPKAVEGEYDPEEQWEDLLGQEEDIPNEQEQDLLDEEEDAPVMVDFLEKNDIPEVEKAIKQVKFADDKLSVWKWK